MAILKTTPGMAHFAALGSFNIITGATKSNSGTVFTQLKPWDERKDKSLQITAMTASLQKRMAAIKGANVLVSLHQRFRDWDKPVDSLLNWNRKKVPMILSSLKKQSILSRQN